MVSTLLEEHGAQIGTPAKRGMFKAIDPEVPLFEGPLAVPDPETPPQPER
jgi:hypothetical protein